MPRLPPTLTQACTDRILQATLTTPPERAAWLALVLGQQPIYDDIDLNGAARPFAVSVVNKLGHAELMTALRGLNLGDPAQTEALCDQLTQHQLNPGPNGQPNLLLAAYHQKCVTRWRDPRYQIDTHFVRLILLRNDEQRGFVQPEGAHEYSDLRELLAATPDRAIVLLGAPGSGKSTLLRRLQMDEAQDRLSSSGNDSGETLTFFVALNRYPGAGVETANPRAWLAEQWRAENPNLGDFDDLLEQGRLLLLLDALNEMRHRDAEDYAARVSGWRDFLYAFAQHGNRAVFTCRSLDYSASLSSEELPVGQVTVKPMTPDLIQEFLGKYLPDAQQAAHVFAQLKADARQLELYSTPYFLSLLVKLVQADGRVPSGRAELFTRFVREALHREVCERKTPLLLDKQLLDARDQTQIANRAWQGYSLPERGLLLPKLTALAFDMQQREQRNDGGQVSLALEAALALLAHPRADDVIKAGDALNVLDENLNEGDKGEVKFFHQLLQEYFAARAWAKAPNPALVQQAWRASEVQPSLAETLAGLSDRDPLPPLPSSGWEETARIAAAMTAAPDAFVRDLMPANLALAGALAAAPDVRVSPQLKDDLRRALVQRSQDPAADLRARIAAGLALGHLGDPRFARRAGKHGDYVLPPLVTIAGGRYTIGEDESDYDQEKPAHEVEIAPFEMGQFAVTNAEYQCFIDAGGYADAQWWDTDAARRWLAGETSEGGKQNWRETRRMLENWTEEKLQDLVQQNRVTSKQVEDWMTIKNWSEKEFEDWLEESFPTGKQYREPAQWSDPQFNNPAQPVVGVCWHETRAYCKWLSAQTGQPFRLPTEAEWEAAARGALLPSPVSTGEGAPSAARGGGRVYAYGDKFDAQHGNTFESHIRKTTPVGIYESGRTSEGLYDLTGNTYDWTSSAYLAYPYEATPEREDATKEADRRVLRGGSWFGIHNLARAAFRFSIHPSNRYYFLGFRVVVSSALFE